jgi:hypothetical protein
MAHWHSRTPVRYSRLRLLSVRARARLRGCGGAAATAQQRSAAHGGTGRRSGGHAAAPGRQRTELRARAVLRVAAAAPCLVG